MLPGTFAFHLPKAHALVLIIPEVRLSVSAKPRGSSFPSHPNTTADLVDARPDSIRSHNQHRWGPSHHVILHSCDQIPKKSQPTEERFVLAHGFKGLHPLWQGGRVGAKQFLPEYPVGRENGAEDGNMQDGPSDLPLPSFSHCLPKMPSYYGFLDFRKIIILTPRRMSC